MAFIKAKVTGIGSVDGKPRKTRISIDGMGIMFLREISILGLHSFSKSEALSDPLESILFFLASSVFFFVRTYNWYN
jgi:hypothetical protein